MSNVVKARYWTVVLYPESMIDNWEEECSYLLQFPFTYCIHDKDLQNNFSEHRKTHVHFLIAFNNTTTMNYVINVFRRLSPSCNYAEAVINVRYMYDYLIHDTDNCRKQNKYVYSPDERILVNNFDIGSYEQISKVEKDSCWKVIRHYILSNKICNIVDLECDIDVCKEFKDNNDLYLLVLKENHSYYERLCRGNWFKYVWCAKQA